MPRATLREMLEAGVHFGHQTRYWNPGMAPYIFGERNKIHIFNLELTQRLLDEAAEAIRQIAAEGKTILVVGTKRAAQDIVRTKAEECEAPYVAHRWLGGTLTNFHTVRNSIKRLQDLRRMDEEGLRKRLSKKEALRLDREQIKLRRSLGGIEAMEQLPDALFVIDVRYENIAVREAQRLDIPVIAVVDTNSSADGIDYVIPGNDDAIRSVQLYMDIVCQAILEGRKEAEEASVATGKDTRAQKGPAERKGKRALLRVSPTKDEKGAVVRASKKGSAETLPEAETDEEVGAKAATEAESEAAVAEETPVVAEAAEETLPEAETDEEVEAEAATEVKPEAAVAEETSADAEAEEEASPEAEADEEIETEAAADAEPETAEAEETPAVAEAVEETPPEAEADEEVEADAATEVEPEAAEAEEAPAVAEAVEETPPEAEADEEVEADAATEVEPEAAEAEEAPAVAEAVEETLPEAEADEQAEAEAESEATVTEDAPDAAEAVAEADAADADTEKEENKS